MSKLTLEEVLDKLDLKRESEVGSNDILLREKYGIEALVPYYVKAFYLIRNWSGRMYISYWLIHFARKKSSVVEMAVYGLKDRSFIVRNYCCRILAYAGNSDVIECLIVHKSHKNQKTREDAAAAIDAIENKNHHLWVDREHTGNFFWKVE